VASSLAGLGVNVTVAELSPHLWGGGLGASLAAWARDRLEGAGITVLTESAADAIEPDGVRAGVDLLPADVVVAGIGVVPRVELAVAAGLDVDDGILTDARHETSAPRIFAAGDVARVDGVRVEHWHASREAGERAALGMLDRPIPPPRAPWIFSEVAGVALDVFGLAREWDEERWVRPGSMLAYVARGRVVQLAVIGSTVEPGLARDLVAPGVSIGELEAALPPL
jgi:NADPH-dependent 2,4-dienoyl-CoA reductase/sulfur reductase-like enzyme